MGGPTEGGTYNPGDLRKGFTAVSDKLPGLYAAPATIDKLTPGEKLLLQNAPVTLLLTPADVLVKKNGKVDEDASGQKLAAILKAYYPDYVLTSSNRRQMIEAFREMETRPQATNYMTGDHVCMMELNPARAPGQMTGLPDSFLRPDKLALMQNATREFTVGHELGHCNDGKAPPAPISAPLVGLKQTIAREASADRQSLQQLKALDDKIFPDKQEALQAIMDERAISGMIRASENYRTGSLDLNVNDHATVALLLRPDASPVTALLAPALANRSIDALIGRLDYVEDMRVRHPDIYKQFMALDADSRRDMAADHGAETAEKNPLTHYAAAKALLQGDAFGKDSLARLSVEKYVEAMERNVDPNMIAHAQDDVARYAAALQAMKPGERAQLAVTVATETAATQEALKDYRNPPEPAAGTAPKT